MKSTKEEQGLAKKLWGQAKADNNLKRMGVAVMISRSNPRRRLSMSAECTWRAYLPEARAMLDPR
jgi:hypothetical protein